MDKFYTIPEEMAKKIREESAKVSTKYRSRTLEYDAYNQFVESQKKEFQEDINIILEKITDLINEGKLYIHTKLIARIKAPESALHNDDVAQMDKNVLMESILQEIDKSDYYVIVRENEEIKSRKTKKLDDVFGITVITDTEDELEILKEELRKTFVIKAEKEKQKTGYKATHIEFFNNKENEESPVVECQLKTRQNYIQSYDHTLYKVESHIERMLYEEGKIGEDKKVKLTKQGIIKIEKTIQKYYEQGRFNIFTNIPRMWEATFNEEKEKMELETLREGQILKRLYPSLIMRPDRTK